MGALNVLQFNQEQAAGTLVALLESENESIRRNVANDILSICREEFEYAQMEERIEALEQESGGCK